MKKHAVTLTAEERRRLQDLITAGKAAARTLARARILLKADAAPGGPAWGDDRIAEALDVSLTTVARVRRRFVELGLDTALNRKTQEQPSRKRVLDSKATDHLRALACSAPPDGRKRWTLRLLAEKVVELGLADTISDETIRRVLKAKGEGTGKPPR